MDGLRTRTGERSCFPGERSRVTLGDMLSPVYGERMLRHVLIAFAGVILLTSCKAPNDDQLPGISVVDWEQVTVCPAKNVTGPPPSFSEASCQKVHLHEVDPQGQLLWLRAIVPLTQTSAGIGEPLALYVSGKMSSVVFFNGVPVGQNGQPGSDKVSELAGRMDAVFYPPQDQFKIGENEVVLLVSSHNGLLNLSQPVHMIGIAPAGLLAYELLGRSAPVLVTFGIFVLGWLYFGVMALISSPRFQFAILGAMSFSVGGQLLSESLRNLVPYAYPIHDLRLIAITVFSSTFGLCVAMYVLRIFKVRYQALIMIGLALSSAIAIALFDGFDFKALAGMSTPLLACLLMTAAWAKQLRSREFGFFLAILTFVGAIFVFRSHFLDTAFFLLVALFLLLIFVDQARTLAKEARERQAEEARANRLEQALAQAEKNIEPGYVDVKGAGRMERIASNDIVHCKGAGGYCELRLTNGRTLLHAASLNDMEETLPATFLRIHRSHLVNVLFIQSLARNPSGTGTLTLTEGVDLPVSRRVMPRVREALN